MASRKQTYVMIDSSGKYLGQGFFTEETARQYAITYMQQNEIGITYAKVEGHIPFVPAGDPDPAEAMLSEHQAMKEAHRRIYGE